MTERRPDPMTLRSTDAATQGDVGKVVYHVTTCRWYSLEVPEFYVAVQLKVETGRVNTARKV